MCIKNKKNYDIGLITAHHWENVGSFLQTYSLFKTIVDLGYSCKIINYRKNYSFKNKCKIFIKKIIFLIYRIFSFIEVNSFLKIKVQNSVTSIDFCKLQKKYFNQTKIYRLEEELEGLEKQFRICLVGSDQIWAPNILDRVYMLSFVKDCIPKYSYASSIGLPKIPEDKKNIYIKYLNRFNRITVREKQGAELLQNLLQNKDIDWVLDPTFLISKQEWIDFSIKPKINEKYLFCYLLGKNKEYLNWIDKIAREKKLKVICLSASIKEYEKNWECISSLNPKLFLGYLKNSELVITDSFHGMALSINLQKNFYVLERFTKEDPINQNSRIYNILNVFKLKDRLLLEEPKEITNIEYDKVNFYFKKEKVRSLNILKEMLKQGCGF